MEKHDINVICAENCGNSPKKKRLLDVYKAYAHHELERIAQYITDDVQWRIVEVDSVLGKQAVLDRLENESKTDITEIALFNIITHGNVAAVNGLIKKKSGCSSEFCTVFEFKSAGKHLIKELTSYVINNPKKQ